MAYPPHTLVAFGGVLNTGQDVPEIWQCGVRGVQPAGDLNPDKPLDDCDTYLTNIQAALKTAFTGSVMIPSVCTLDWIKANNIGADGKYVDPVTHMYSYSPSGTGGGVAKHPDVLAVRVTWKTAASRGPAHLGGIYLPAYAADSDIAGGSRISSGSVTNILSTAANILTALENKGAAFGTGVHFAPCVVSKVSGTFRPITGTRVGNVWDIQRRRKSALHESYTNGTWTP